MSVLFENSTACGTLLEKRDQIIHEVLRKKHSRKQDQIILSYFKHLGKSPQTDVLSIIVALVNALASNGVSANNISNSLSFLQSLCGKKAELTSESLKLIQNSRDESPKNTSKSKFSQLNTILKDINCFNFGLSKQSDLSRSSVAQSIVVDHGSLPSVDHVEYPLDKNSEDNNKNKEGSAIAGDTHVVSQDFEIESEIPPTANAAASICVVDEDKTIPSNQEFSTIEQPKKNADRRSEVEHSEDENLSAPSVQKSRGQDYPSCEPKGDLLGVKPKRKRRKPMSSSSKVSNEVCAEKVDDKNGNSAIVKTIKNASKYDLTPEESSRLDLLTTSFCQDLHVRKAVFKFWCRTNQFEDASVAESDLPITPRQAHHLSVKIMTGLNHRFQLLSDVAPDQ